MGNNASNQYEQINNKTDFTFTYQLLKKINEPHYGEVKVVRDIKTGEQIYLKEVVLTTKETYQAELDFYNKRITVSHPNVVRIYGCNGTDQQNFCASYYKISVFIEMLPKTLAQELESRFDSFIPFSENDILLIAENLIAGLSYFEAQDVFHGDIRPENIFVANNSFKLSDPNLYPQRNANALSHVLLGQAKTLLSPQLLAQVPQNDFQIKCNKFKADVFSLGATLLSLASLTDTKELYDYENGVFHSEGLGERLELVRKSYSKFTFDLIRDMLKIREEERPDFIALQNRLLPYQEDIRQKSELPFFGIRAPYQEKKKEDHLDISRYTYEEKANPILMDFINSQMSQSTVKRKPQRDSIGSSGRAEDIMPSHDAFGRERDSAQESFRKTGNLMAEFEKTEVHQSPYYHHHQQEVTPYTQNNLAEQLYREEPTRNPFLGRNVQPQYEQNRRAQSFQHLSIQHQQEQQPQYIKHHADTARPVQVINEVIVETYQQPQYETQVHYESQTKSFPEPQTHRQIEYYQQQPTYFQPQVHYTTTQAPTHIEQTVHISEPQPQPQIHQESANEQLESNDLDDLEAKIRAALERSEATYRRASRPPQGSPGTSQQSAKKSAPPSEFSSLQTHSPKISGGLEGIDIAVSHSVYVKPAEKEFAKTHDLNSSPPHHSEMPTNALSGDNTLYDFNPAILTQSGVSNYYSTPGYNPGAGQYQQRPIGGENWGANQYDQRADKNFYSFANPLGADGLQRHEHNALEQKTLIQHAIQD